MVVFAAADQDPTVVVVVDLWAKLAVDQGDVEVQLACSLVLELDRLKFDDEVAQLLDVEKRPVDSEVFALDLEVHPPADEHEPLSLSLVVKFAMPAASSRR